MRTIVLDSGAFIAMGRREPEICFYIAQARKRNKGRIVLPTLVLCEVWKPVPRHGSAMLREAVHINVGVDVRHASEIGALLSKTNTKQIVDAAVALTAIEHRPSLVLTSDPNDIARLVRAAGATCGFEKEFSDVRIARI